MEDNKIQESSLLMTSYSVSCSFLYIISWIFHSQKSFNSGVSDKKMNVERNIDLSEKIREKITKYKQQTLESTIISHLFQSVRVKVRTYVRMSREDKKWTP